MTYLQTKRVFVFEVSKEMICVAKELSGSFISKTKGSIDCINFDFSSSILSRTKCRDLKISNFGFFSYEFCIDYSMY